MPKLYCTLAEGVLSKCGLVPQFDATASDFHPVNEDVAVPNVVLGEKFSKN